jgi:hypothetical protein
MLKKEVDPYNFLLSKIPGNCDLDSCTAHAAIARKLSQKLQNNKKPTTLRKVDPQFLTGIDRNCMCTLSKVSGVTLRISHALGKFGHVEKPMTK